MYRVLMCAALAGVLAVPAKALDGTQTPSPPNVPPLKAEPLPPGLLAQAPNPAQAQSLRDQLVSCNPNIQEIASACGTNPNGIIIYDASGRYAWIIAGRGRPKVSAFRNSPAEELKPLVAGLLTQFGKWSVNEADKTITLHIDGALFPNVEGTEEGPPAPFSVSGDELRISYNNGQNVFRRIKR
jgi:Lipocalin-like domain